MKLGGIKLEKVMIKNIERYIELNNELSLEDPYNLKVDKTKFLDDNGDKLLSGKLSIYIKTYENKDIGFIEIFDNGQNTLFIEKIFLIKDLRNARRYKEILDFLIEIKNDRIIKFIGVNDKKALMEALREKSFKMEKEHVHMEKDLLDYEDSFLFDETMTFGEIGNTKWIFDFMKNCMKGSVFNYSLNEVDRLVKSKNDLCLVFYKDNNPIGFITAFINEQRNAQQNKKVIYIEEIAINRMFRNKGFGKSAINHILNKGLEKGMDTGRLHVYRDNIKAYELYRKLGFKEVKSIGHWVKDQTKTHQY